MRKQDKLLRYFKGSISVSEQQRSTRIFAVVSNPVKEKNFTNSIGCKDCIPLGGFVYDAQSDSYLLQCVDYLDVGTVSISLSLTMEGFSNWHINVPIPEKALKDYLSSKQKKDIKKFFSTFDNNFLFSYVQMLDSNV